MTGRGAADGETGLPGADDDGEAPLVQTGMQRRSRERDDPEPDQPISEIGDRGQ